MAKNKSAADRIAELEAEIQRIKDEEAKAAVDLANDKLAALQDALKEYNDAAKATGGRLQARRLITDAETGGGKTRAAGGKRLRLDSEAADSLKSEIVKAAKAYKSEGASRKQIIERLSSGNVGFVDGQHYNDGFITRFIAELKADGKLTQQGDKSTARYVAA